MNGSNVTKWFLGCSVALLLAIPSSSRADDTPAPGKPDKHIEVSMEGWTVRIDSRLRCGADAKLGEQAERMLAARLADIAMVVPAHQLEKLRSYVIVLDLNHGQLGTMQYHPSVRWLESHGYSSDLARCVHIPVAKRFVNSRQVNEQPWAVLHELAHAYHDQELGFNESRIMKAYRKFKESGRGDQALLYNGKRVKHYGLTDQKEFFAEMSEAYIGCNDFFPFNGAELQVAEPEIFALMREIWGPIDRTR